MIYQVKVFDANGELKELIPAEQVKKMYWEKVDKEKKNMFRKHYSKTDKGKTK